MNRAIEVTVDPTGGVVVRALGFAGPACREAGRALEQALGLVASEELTPQYYQAPALEQPARESERAG